MFKILIIIAVIIGIAVAVYYGRYFFTKRVVDEAAPSAMSTGVQAIRQGEFQEIDFIHKGSGRASVIEGITGEKILRFEDFKVTNGPDLYVYLSKNPQPTNKASLLDFVNLGVLKGTAGNQNYELPDQVEDYKSVVIWCQRFGVLFSYATLE